MQDDFPFKRYYLKHQSLVEQARRYKSVYVSAKKVGNKEAIFGVLTNGLSKDFKINDLTDIFTEECRIKCRLEYREMSPFTYFQENKVKLVEELEKKNKPLNFRNLNEMIYRKSGQCTNYKLTYLLGVLKHFKPKRWLDMSAGWGDRLISAIIYGIDRYVGVDPNDCLHTNEGKYPSGYNGIIETLVPKKLRQNFTVINGKAEGIDYLELKEKFDFIFTSPPFFTFELYDESEKGKSKQSVALYNSIDRWLNEFLFVTADKAWEVLEEGGHYLLYIEDKGYTANGEKYPFIDKLKEHMSEKKGCLYKRIMYQVFQDDRFPKNPFKYHTVFVWQKV